MQRNAEIAADLGKVASAWDSLPANARRAMLQIVEDAKQSGRQTKET